jgi:hypothetical protein
MKPAMLEGTIIEEWELDNNGMFDWHTGYVQLPDQRYRAYIHTGWGGGYAGKTVDTPEEARRDMYRLEDKYL